MVLTAVAEVGTALTVVGAVTGNKDMMKVGGVMGLVGGVGGPYKAKIDPRLMPVVHEDREGGPAGDVLAAARAT
jgi:hypothetical protein